MPLPAQKVDEAFQSAKLNRVFGPGVTNFISTSTNINQLEYDHGKSKQELIILREQLMKTFIQANLTVDKKKLILENLITESKTIETDNSNSDSIKVELKKQSILLTRRITQLKENVSKINRINQFIKSFKDGNLIINEDKYNEIFKDLKFKLDPKKMRKYGNNNYIITVDINKDLKELQELNNELINDKNALINEIEEIKLSYQRNVDLFNQIVKLSGANDESDENMKDEEESEEEKI